MVSARAGAASERMKVLALPLVAVGPTVAVGLAPVGTDTLPELAAVIRP